MPRATRRQLQSFDRDVSTQASSSSPVASSSRPRGGWDYAASPSHSTYNTDNDDEPEIEADIDGYGRMDDIENDGGSAWGEADDGDGDGLEEEDLEPYAHDDDEEEDTDLDRSGKRKTMYGRGTEPSDSESSTVGTPARGSKRVRPTITPTSTSKRRKTTEQTYTPSPSKSTGRKKKSTASTATNTNWWTRLLATASAAGGGGDGDDLAIGGAGGGGGGGFTSLNAADRYFLAAARPKVRMGVNGQEQGVDGDGYGFDQESEEDKSGSEDDEGEEVGEKGEKGKRGLLPHANGGSKPEKRQTRQQKSEVAMVELKKSYRYWESLLLGASSVPTSVSTTTTNTPTTPHSLLFHGHGSKRSLLNDFTKTNLTSLGHIITINGLYPGMGIKVILDEVEGMFEEMRVVGVEDGVFGSWDDGDGLGEKEVKGLDKLAARVYKYFLPSEVFPRTGTGTGTVTGKTTVQPTSSKPLFLIIHNIDSPSLRTPQSLSILSLLALNPRIHLIASFDHANTPILFSSTETRASKHVYARGGLKGKITSTRGFGWAWIRADTYEAYTLEGEWMRQRVGGVRAAELGGGGSGQHGSNGDVTEEGAQRILHSVPPMARRLFKLLATRQLASIRSTDIKQSLPYPLTATTPSAPAYAIDNDILQTLARDKFIAREEERYNAQMGEFRDHGLIVEHVVDVEGRAGRWVWIPIARAVLERVVGTMTAVEG